ncbi:hypothetical protein [Actinoplanes sp. NPDC051851]|uniref:hypothetical protein n=1 Tax=Actinoplanes sp. NPDC051851 TaxID=3154753 RepID=UPI00344A61A6
MPTHHAADRAFGSQTVLTMASCMVAFTRATAGAIATRHLDPIADADTGPGPLLRPETIDR